jgi:hypothetical protein
MKRRFLWVFIAGIMLFCTRSLAITGDNNGDGIVSLDETGELVAMLQTRLRELDYFHFKPTGRYQSMTRNAVIEFRKTRLRRRRTVIATGRRRAKRRNIVFLRRVRALSLRV